MSRPVLIVLVSVLVMLGPFTNNIVIPSLPAISDALAVPYRDVQFLLTVYIAGFAIGQLFVGPLSDRFGRRPVLLAALTSYVFTSGACALTDDLGLLVFIRLLQAIGVSATLSVGRAIVRDVFESDRIAQVYAYVGTALAIGPILGPVFGGYLQAAFGWRSVFVFVTAVGVAILAVIVFLMGETNRNREHAAAGPGQIAANYVRLLGTRRYMGYVLCNAICYGGIFAFTTCSAYVLIDLLGVTPEHFGTLYAITVGAYGVGTLAASQITRRAGINRMIVTGGLIMTLAGAAMLALPMAGLFDVWTVVIPFAVFSFGTGFVFPSGQAGGILPYPHMAGAASSMLSFLQMTTAAVAGALSARFLDGTPMPLAWTVFFAGPAMLFSFWWLILRHPEEGTAP